MNEEDIWPYIRHLNVRIRKLEGGGAEGGGISARQLIDALYKFPVSNRVITKVYMNGTCIPGVCVQLLVACEDGSIELMSE